MSAGSLVHDALFYADDRAYVEGIRQFASEGLADDGSVLIAVPARKLALLRSALSGFDGQIEFADMVEAGRNPARIVPFIRAFLDSHPRGPVRFVGEPIWGDRTRPEIVEGVRHEALINQAFARSLAHILCPYDVRELSNDVLDDARRTHPTILSDGVRSPCTHYVEPLLMYAAADRPLPEPGGDPVQVPLAEGLSHLRGVVEAEARSTGADPDRVSGFVIAANEAAANTLVHAGGRGLARIWHDGGDLVFEIADGGVIDDPLAGRCAPPADQEGGRGLWLINQLCDLVELRSGPSGTVIRIHLQLA